MSSSLDDVLKLIKEYLKLSKDLAQLLEGDNSLINNFNSQTHRIHGKADTLGTTTGRFTHNSPNLSQVPKDPEFRKLLCVPKGKLFVDVDADALNARAFKRD